MLSENHLLRLPVVISNNRLTITRLSLDMHACECAFEAWTGLQNAEGAACATEASPVAKERAGAEVISTSDVNLCKGRADAN